MPRLSTPRIAVGLMVSPGSLASGRATMTESPFLALGAPQTIWQTPYFGPSSTWRTWRWSEFGWGSHSMIFPTTSPVASDSLSMPSTSAPAKVSRLASSSALSSAWTWACRKFKDNFMVIPPYLALKGERKR